MTHPSNLTVALMWQNVFCPSLAEPCIIDENVMKQHKIEFKYNDLKMMYSGHNDVIEFGCAKRRPVDPVSMRQKCNDGVMQLPTCQ